MKKYVKNLYWRVTLKRHNEGVDAGRWNVTKKITSHVYAYWGKEISADELADRLMSIVYSEQLYKFGKTLDDAPNEREQR
jgi:hypothetical protein